MNEGISTELADKVETLRKIIADQQTMVVAYSGGVDSSLLAYLSNRVLGERSLAVLLDAPVVPPRQVREAVLLAERLGLRFRVVRFQCLDSSDFRANPVVRCYLCKKRSAVILRGVADEAGIATIADGVNVDDLGEYRPGLDACAEAGIIHPFVLAGITKADIRRIAQAESLPVWNKPAAACLASRIPYGERITEDLLSRIEQAEEVLHDSGFAQVRVRVHGPIARIEVVPDQIPKLVEHRDEIVTALESLGFRYVTVDLKGFRSGSMDESIRTRT